MAWCDSQLLKLLSNVLYSLFSWTFFIDDLKSLTSSSTYCYVQLMTETSFEASKLCPIIILQWLYLNKHLLIITACKQLMFSRVKIDNRSDQWSNFCQDMCSVMVSVYLFIFCFYFHFYLLENITHTCIHIDIHILYLDVKPHFLTATPTQVPRYISLITSYPPFIILIQLTN